MKQNKLKKEFLNEEAKSERLGFFGFESKKKGSTVRASGESPPPCSSQLTKSVVAFSARYGDQCFDSEDRRENQ